MERLRALKVVQGSRQQNRSTALRAGAESVCFDSLPTSSTNVLRRTLPRVASPASNTTHITGPAPRWDKGEVVAELTRMPLWGLNLLRQQVLNLAIPELKGNPGTLPLVVTINAAGERIPATARKAMAFLSRPRLSLSLWRGDHFIGLRAEHQFRDRQKRVRGYELPHDIGWAAPCHRELDYWAVDVYTSTVQFPQSMLPSQPMALGKLSYALRTGAIAFRL